MSDAKELWHYYELGRRFNQSLSPDQYTVVHTNTEFFHGNQWIHMANNDAMKRLAKPVFNIIKRVATLFVASLTSSSTTISFSPLSCHDDPEAAEFATAEVRNLLEKFKFEYQIRDALFDGAITGDYAAHFFWDPDAKPYGGAFGEFRGEIEMELVDGINVMFGNPNITDVERQPYVIVAGRDTVENLKREAQRYSAETDADAIRPDAEHNDFDGYGARYEPGDNDRTGKALYIYFYEKVGTGGDATVHVSKLTRDCMIFEDIDTGLSRYPIAWGNWQKQKNRYHGRALVTEIIPNQIFINQMMAMVFRHLQTQAFPTKIFNADLLPNYSNEVGTAIGIRNLLPGQTPGDIITTLPAADMSNQIMQAIDTTMSYTKECLGATEAQLGNTQATNTSAIMVLQNTSEVPLENIRSGLHAWVEDIGAILLDMMGTYYGIRPVVRRKTFQSPVIGANGQPVFDAAAMQYTMQPQERTVIEPYDFRVFKNLWLNISADVGATTYYSEIAMVQTLDNLRKDGFLTPEQYLERVPDKLIPKKQELLEELRAAGGMTQPGGSAASGGGFTMGAEIDADKQIGNLPGRIQGAYNDLPNAAKKALF